MSSLVSRFLAMFQYLLPRYAVTALVHRLSRIRNRRVKDFLIERFARMYAVDLSEVERSAPGGFESLNDFFTRELAPGARPIDDSTTSIVSPADGAVSAAGRIDGRLIVQAKGRRYGLHDLLPTNLDEADRFVDGLFATIYLAPHNYHRVHAPLGGELVSARYVPGDLFSVNASSVSAIPGLFCRNERLALAFDTAAGPVAVVLVGALNVGSITTPWTGEIRPTRRGVGAELELPGVAARRIGKGDLLGWFNMGSTVIVLLPAGAASWREDLVAGATCRVGRPIGTLGQA